ISAVILLYCFTSTRTGEVYKSTARRARARESQGYKSDKELEARVIAACYKYFVLTIKRIEGVPILVLTY
ncbi:Zinc fingerC2H2, partial [Penicillium daleae]